MAKLAIFRYAFVAGSITFIGAEGSQIAFSSEKRLQAGPLIAPQERGQLGQDIDQKSPIDPKLVEYFKNEDATEENESHRSSPRRNYVVYIHQAIWNNDKRSGVKDSEGMWTRILRRLQFFEGTDDKGNTDKKNRNDDNKENHALMYPNYVKEEVEEHKEVLITEDDALNFKIDDDTPTWTPPRATAAPTPVDSTFWDPLDGLDATGTTKSNITDTDILIDRPHNSVILRLALGVVNRNAMTDEDIDNIIHMAGRALSIVLNKDEEIPFIVYDRNRELTVTRLPPSSVRGQGKPQTRYDTSTTGRGEKYLAKLLLDSVVADFVVNNWWEITATYTVWRNGDAAPVNSRAILKKIEGICGHSIEKSMDHQLYWEALKNVKIGDQDLVIPGDMYFADDKGVMDAKDVGDEYDMSSFYCPLNRTYEDQDVCLSCSPLEVEWGTREWVGIGLICSTIFVVVSLSLIANCVNKKRNRQLLWGAALTHDGVDDILQVGWRIHEEPPQEQSPGGLTPEEVQQQQTQLYLHVYDKGGEGYNDENSLLKGGVEQAVFAPSADANLYGHVANPNESS